MNIYEGIVAARRKLLIEIAPLPAAVAMAPDAYRNFKISIPERDKVNPGATFAGFHVFEDDTLQPGEWRFVERKKTRITHRGASDLSANDSQRRCSAPQIDVK